jgi:hypothetical protein
VTRVELHVDHLVLHGFTPAGAERFRAAFAGELAARLGGGGLPPRTRATERLELRPPRPLSAAEPERAGVDTARALAEGVLRC